MSAPAAKPARRPWLGLGLVLLGAGVVYMITSLVLGMGGEKLLDEKLPATGGVVGPVKIEQANQVVAVQVRHRLPLTSAGSWSFVTVSLLNEQREYLTGFGDEMWHQAGYSSDGRWEQSVNGYTGKLTFPKPGSYYFKFAIESNIPATDQPPVDVVISKEAASTVPHFTAGLLLMIAGGVLVFFAVFLGGGFGGKSAAKTWSVSKD